MIAATRVGVLTNPEPSRFHPCPRCGRKFSPSDENVVLDAPCRDCREYLREEEGDKTVWDRRRLRRIEQKESAS